MTTLNLAFSLHHGLSLHGSQGNQDGARTYVEILQKISSLRNKYAADGRTNPEEKARIMLDIISMLNNFCEINHLGVKSIKEEFHDRFEEYLPGHPVDKEKVPKLSVKTAMSLGAIRIIPLYAPTVGSGRDNCLTSWKKPAKEGEQELRTAVFLFIDTDGKVLSFESKSLVKGHMVEYEHEVLIGYVSQEELAHYLGATHLMFDYCMRTLIQLCEGAIHRALERADAARKAADALITITEEMRRDDLTTLILLSEESPRGMGDCGINKDKFRKIAEAAGSTPETRVNELERQCIILGRKEITSISDLTMATTMEIIREWKIEKKV
jgi:hypothetical protein